MWLQKLTTTAPKHPASRDTDEKATKKQRLLLLNQEARHGTLPIPSHQNVQKPSISHS